MQSLKNWIVLWKFMYYHTISNVYISFYFVVNTAAFKITSHLLKGHVEKSQNVIIDKITNKAVPLTGF